MRLQFSLALVAVSSVSNVVFSSYSRLPFRNSQKRVGNGVAAVLLFATIVKAPSQCPYAST